VAAAEIERAGFVIAARILDKTCPWRLAFFKSERVEKENFMGEIKDKIVVITGASSGIGEAAAVMLAERGAKVVLGARGFDRLEALALQIAGAGGEVAYAQTAQPSAIWCQT
jgi:NADPH:quinone reductase-like Zn-dependent oxidoreductase